MSYGKSSVTSDAMNQHKRMAGADQSGNFGVTPFPGSSRSTKKARPGSDGFTREGKA